MTEFLPILILGVALAVDLLFGDLPNRLHPVVAMGNWIAWTRRLGRRMPNEAMRFCIGLLSLVLGGLALIAIGWLIERYSRELPLPVAVCIQAAVLKCTFSIRSLAAAANTVASALHASDLPLARKQLSYHLVSRDTAQLDEAAVAAAAVESVAENTSDSFIAPLFYFTIAGLPGALLYRYINTCDAMLGYRTPELEWLGKPAARADDLLNLIPARLTAILMLVVGPSRSKIADGKYSIRKSVTIWWRDHRLTASPNAGHPMSAAAGILGVVLEKQDHYRLGRGQPLPSVSTIDAMNSLLYRTALAASLLAIAWMIGSNIYFHGILYQGSKS